MPKRGPKTGSGEGSVYQRASDGRWVASFSDVSGRRRQLYADSEREVRRRLRTALAERDRGISTTDLTLGQWLHQWLAAIDLRPTTVADYRYKVSLLPRWALDRTLGEFSPADVQRVLDEIAVTPTATGRTRAASTVAQVRSVLRRALGQAERWGLVGRNVASLVDAPEVDETEIEPLTIDEVRALLAELEDHRLASLYTVAVAVGLRRGEALYLKWADVDLEAAMLRVRRQLTTTNRGEVVIGPPKTRGSIRRLALPGFCVARLEEHRRVQTAERASAGDAWQDHDLVWPSRLGTPLSPRNLLRHLHRTCERGGIRRVSFHTLRHSAATIMLAQGVPERVIMEVLGHSTTAMMVRYQHVTDALRDDAAAAMDRAFGDPDET
jgi:integrase